MMTKRFSRHPLVLFFVLAYLLSWVFWLPAAVLGAAIESPTGRTLEIAGNFGPILAALVLAYATQGLPGLRSLGERLVRWRVSFRWYLAALLGPFVLMGVAIAMTFVLGGLPATSFAPGNLVALFPAFFHTLLLAGGLNEETGWRGYALPGLLEKMRPFQASILLGILWGLWHVPLYFVPGTGQNEMIQSGASFFVLLAAFVFWTIGLSIIFTWLSDRTRSSLLLAILFHAAINTAAGLPNALGVHGSMAALLFPALTWLIAFIVSRSRSFSINPEHPKLSMVSGQKGEETV